MSEEDYGLAMPNEPEVIPARVKSPRERELELINLAMDESERRLRNGEASGAEIIYWLKRGSAREQHELFNLQAQGRLLDAKANAVKAEQDANEMFADAMKALSGYRSSEEPQLVDGDYHD